MGVSVSPHVFISPKAAEFKALTREFKYESSFNNNGRGGFDSIGQELATRQAVCHAKPSICSGRFRQSIDNALIPNMDGNNHTLQTLAAGGIIAINGQGDSATERDPERSTYLYRAMTEAETADISATGLFRNTPGINSKYFSIREGAIDYMRQAQKAYGHIDGQYSLVRTAVANSLLSQIEEPTSVDGGGIPAYLIPTSNLTGLIPDLLEAEDPK